MEKLLTTKDLALALGVSESSLRRWTNSGAIKTAKTPGGHRRIPLSEAIRYIRDSHAPILKPEILGLEIPSPVSSQQPDSPSLNLLQALVNGDATAARGQILSFYLSGLSIPNLFDGPVCFAMHRVGELWKHDPQGILVEHRATDICIGALSALRQLLPEPPANAPVALGATPPDDPYILPCSMAAAVLADAGYHENNFGPQVPLPLLADAALSKKAALVWLSISSIANPAALRNEVETLANRLAAEKIPLAIGGRVALEILSTPIPNVHPMNSMADLSAFAKRIR